MFTRVLRAALVAAFIAVSTVGTGAAAAQSAAGGVTPIGRLDQVIVFGSTITVRGWALDLDAPLRSSTVHVYVDGRAHNLGPASSPRLDIAQAYPGAASPHGFDTGLRFDPTPGRHTVCAYAIDDRAGGTNPLLGCREFTLTGSATRSPVGSVDPLEFFPDGRVVVRGWAADPDDIDSRLQVHVYVDGRGVAVERTGEPNYRADVAAATGAQQAGFVAILPTQGPGPHRVCAYGINIGAGTNALIGCRSFFDETDV